MKSLYKKYEELILYGIFGVCTVLVNTLCYWGLSFVMGDLAANTIAFFIAVQFAYMTNTHFVFRERFTKTSFLLFWGMRIGTIFVDNGLMWLFLNMKIDGIIAKCIVNVVIIIVNYICSKFIIFKKK